MVAVYSSMLIRMVNRNVLFIKCIGKVVAILQVSTPQMITYDLSHVRVYIER